MKTPSRDGFTLIELLVVISIIALLIAILLPSLAASRTTAQLVRSGAQLRDLQLSLHRYTSDNRSFTPWINFPRSNNAASPYLTGTYKYANFPWSAVLWDKYYVEVWQAFWSPARDLRASYNLGGLSLYEKLTTTTLNEMTTRDSGSYGGSNLNYWRMVGYGMAGDETGDINSINGYFNKANVVNLETARFQLGNAISMAECWNSSGQSPGSPPASGYYWIKPVHTPLSNVSYLFNYNSNVARAYWDGHVATGNSLAIGWNSAATTGTYVGGPYGGTWTYTWWSGTGGYWGTKPWYINTDPPNPVLDTY